MNNKVYIILGTHIADGDIFSSISSVGVKSSYENALKELDLIRQEFIKDCVENEINDVQEFKSKDIIRFVYDNDNEENYKIVERTIDLEEEK